MSGTACGRLAGERGLTVGLGEGCGDVLLVSGLRAFQAILEAGNEATAANDNRHIRALATWECDTVDAADEVDGNLIALDGDAAFLSLERRAALE